MRFEFATAGRIVFGAGGSRDLPRIARSYGDRALLVLGSSSRGPDWPSLLTQAGVTSVVFRVPGEPDIDRILAGVAAAREHSADVVVAIGGGSVVDAGKAIAALLRNPGDILDYLEVIGRAQPLMAPSAPFIAVPTTAGTGSEVTRNAVLASAEHRVKVSLRSPWMLPAVALVDPELTYGLPPALTAATGLDALTQLIEPFVCLRANPMTDGICREGMSRAARALPRACRQPDDTLARTDMCVASLFGGMALANAGLGAVHGFAGPLGGMYPAPHGAVCAALLPHVMAANCAALRRQQKAETLARYDEVARCLTGKPSARAEDGIAWTRDLVRELQVPPLSAYGIRPEHSPDIVSRAAQASSMKANPVGFEPAELTDILAAAIAGV